MQLYLAFELARVRPENAGKWPILLLVICRWEVQCCRQVYSIIALVPEEPKAHVVRCQAICSRFKSVTASMQRSIPVYLMTSLCSSRMLGYGCGKSERSRSDGEDPFPPAFRLLMKYCGWSRTVSRVSKITKSSELQDKKPPPQKLITSSKLHLCWPICQMPGCHFASKRELCQSNLTINASGCKYHTCILYSLKFSLYFIRCLPSISNKSQKAWIVVIEADNLVVSPSLILDNRIAARLTLL